MLAVYVSGHGFGHATRTAEVLRVLRRRAPALPIVVSSALPPSLFSVAIAPPLELRRLECDVGLAQQDALRIDEAASLARWRAFAAGWDARVAAEGRFLRERGARLVLGDIPPLAFAVAAEAGVPAIALGNFSWDWIYRNLAARCEGFDEAARAAAAAYTHADLLLQLPFAGDLSAFSRREEIALIARRPSVAKAETRRRLGLDVSRPALLYSFGGLGLKGIELGRGVLRDWEVLWTGVAEDRAGLEGVRVVDGVALAAAGLDYPDLVGAVDVVVTKPGYGIVSDCIGAGTRLVYTDRGDFPEYPILVAGMARYLPVAYATNGEVRTGGLARALDQVLSQAWPAAPELSGADEAAARLLARLG